MSAPSKNLVELPPLRAASRLAGALPRSFGLTSELALLLGAGACAALSVVLIEIDVRWLTHGYLDKLPGHAILKAFPPLALGFALAPRRGAGVTMSLGAFAGLVALRFFGQGSGLGATTSLLALGPSLDLFLTRARSNWTIYLRFALGGLAANLLAFAVRGGGKVIKLDNISMRPLAEWVTVAPWTYAACGLAAGLLCSVCLFRWSPPRETK